MKRDMKATGQLFRLWRAHGKNLYYFMKTVVYAFPPKESIDVNMQGEKRRLRQEKVYLFPRVRRGGKTGENRSSIRRREKPQKREVLLPPSYGRETLFFRRRWAGKKEGGGKKL